ncbi:MAG: pyridoxine 5'-phosphate synthase [Proteobacteria bacterium]|nr:pyridoxine 5'-phosphate synthase [Pseudomonadota bacterium]
MKRLSINVDHVATLRQARKGREPDPVFAAVLAELAGADGIIVHLREDRRHIQDRDLEELKKIVKTKLNLEMANAQEIIRTALFIKPDMVTLVPERREELTTEGGLEVNLNQDAIATSIRTFHEGGILVSLFINPDLDQVKAAHRIQADIVEIHTGVYSDTVGVKEVEKELGRVINAAKLADKLGLKVHAGHGLNYQNVQRITAIEEIEELSVGHSIISRAVLVGMERAVREMRDLIQLASGK